METTPFPPHVYNWLRERGITPEVIVSSRLSWNGLNIVIPIYDENNVFLYNKYRKDPRDTSDGFKYFYEKGNKFALYNKHILANTDIVFIVEGELDCLRLASVNIPAVSSTGGASSFSIEWAPLFDYKEVYICLDADEAGWKGSIKIQKHIPHAKIVWLPRGEFKGKDVTDFLNDKGLKEFVALSQEAQRHTIPHEFNHVPETKTELEKKRNEYRDAIEEANLLKRKMLRTRTPAGPMIFLISYLTERYKHYDERAKNFKRPVINKENEDRVFLARQVPIPSYITFNYNNFAFCIFHNEKTPSMKYNDFKSKYPNTVKCFACGEMADVIDVVMELKKVDFKKALDILVQ